MNAQAWDVRAVYRQVRARDHALTDRIPPLMVRESALEAEIAEMVGRETRLVDAVATIERLGGDASIHREQLTKLEPQVQVRQSALAAIKEELRLIRANLKWIDQAHSALHWACFTDPELARFDEARARDNGRLPKGEDSRSEAECEASQSGGEANRPTPSSKAREDQR